jgi:hypothetical protein
MLLLKNPLMREMRLDQNTRRHYRIPYPVAARPEGSFAGKPFFVVDLSEEGTKIQFTDAVQMPKGQMIRSRIKFQDGEIFEITGKVIRQESPVLIVMQLVEGIPLSKIMSEQRYLIQTFPKGLLEQNSGDDVED